jgi:dTMP kinase
MLKTAPAQFPGKFIVFEGGDGCGKTTQLRLLYDWLNQSGRLPPHQAVIMTKEPGGTGLGQALRSILLGNQEIGETLDPYAELMLYAADRAQHVETFLKPHLATGAIVLCDRYTDSTVAYQGYGRGLDLGIIQHLNQMATGGLTSDLTLCLDVEVSVSRGRLRQRGQADRMEQADPYFHEQVRRGFMTLCQQYPDRIVSIDAGGDEVQVAQTIQKLIAHRLNLPL